jgi:hypothetical protein
MMASGQLHAPTVFVSAERELAIQFTVDWAVSTNTLNDVKKKYINRKQ